MTNLLEFVLIYITILVFCPNNILSVVYTLLSVTTYITYFIYYKCICKNKEQSVQKKKMDVQFFIILIMIISVNLIVKLEFVNFVFGIVIALIYLIATIKMIILKEDVRNVSIIRSDLIFDFYSLLYFCGLAMQVLINEF